MSSQEHKIQYHAQGRAKDGSHEFGCDAYYSLMCEGSTLQDARQNGKSTALLLAEEKLLEKARERSPQAAILPNSIRVS